MSTETPQVRALIVDLSEDLVANTAPEELEIFDELVEEIEVAVGPELRGEVPNG